jgi:hypothetical protein
MIRVYRRKFGSTHDGNSRPLECKAVMAWSGLGAVVDTARITKFDDLISYFTIMTFKTHTCHRVIPSFRF